MNTKDALFHQSLGTLRRPRKRTWVLQECLWQLGRHVTLTFRRNQAACFPPTIPSGSLTLGCCYLRELQTKRGKINQGKDTHAHTHTCTHTHSYTFSLTHMHVYKQSHAYMFTHTCTHTQSHSCAHTHTQKVACFCTAPQSSGAVTLDKRRADNEQEEGFGTSLSPPCHAGRSAVATIQSSGHLQKSSGFRLASES